MTLPARRLLLATPLALLTLALPANAPAATSAFDPVAAKLTLNVAGSPETRVSRGPGGAILVDGVAAGAATVANTDTIAALGGTGDQRLVVDLAGGVLAPGKSAESDTAEIEVTFDGGPGADHVMVWGTSAANAIRFGAAGVGLNADADADVTGTGLESYGADGKGGNDVLDGAASTLGLRLVGGGGADRLIGGGGADMLEGGVGADTELGNGAGDHFLQDKVSNGADHLDGGSSPYDYLDYTSRTAAVTVDLDGVADDGAAGELDNALDTIEYVDGGAGADSLTGNPALYQSVRLRGNGGADTLTGASSYDYLDGGDGADTIAGLDGSDSLTGGPGNDVIDGGAAADTFFEDETPDAANGRDDLRGGTGADTADYGNRTAPLKVTMADEQANDGASGEGDNVRNDVEAINGGKGPDQITGNALPNKLSGGAGDDTLVALGGDDVIEAHYGNDSANGGPGKDQVNGGDGDDTLKGDADPDDLRGGYGADTVDAGAGADRAWGDQGEDVFPQTATVDGADLVTGGADKDTVTYAARKGAVAVTLDAIDNDGSPAGAGEHDRILEVEQAIGGLAADTLRGSANADTLRGGPGNDKLDGLEGDDTLDGGGHTDVMTGGAGTDVSDYSARTTTVQVSLDGVANDGEPVPGTYDSQEKDNADTERVRGGSGNDRLGGGAGDNELDGGEGDDLLDGVQGADRMVGGPGVDTASYGGRTTSVKVTLDGAANDGGPSEGDDIELDVENVHGSFAGDELIGGPQADGLYGGPGDDRLDGRGGADVLDGQAGRDTADYSARTTSLAIVLDANAGDGESGENDRVTPATEIVEGGSAGDSLFGGDGDDELRGNGGDDTLEGGAGGFGHPTGADVLRGGPGTDTASYRDRISSDPVTVTVEGLANDGAPGENDDVKPDVENLIGGFGDDELHGSDGPNVISGGPLGQDKLYGHNGDDRLDESADPVNFKIDPDELFGGDGRDVADYSGRSVNLMVSLDDVADDGVRIDNPDPDPSAGEGDNVHSDVEDVVTGAGNDWVIGSDAANRIQTGAAVDRVEARDGHDELIGGADVDRLFGEVGNDRLVGGEGNNSLTGGTGDDTFVEDAAWTGNDGFTGGPGRDTVDYGARTVRLVIDNDGVTGDDGQDANGDGVPEEKDRIALDVEVLKGGSAGDRITSGVETGTLGCVALYGGAGNDVITGSQSDTSEALLGDAGEDVLEGLGGNDRLSGGEGNDEEHGGDGWDKFVQGKMTPSCNNGYSVNYANGPDGADWLDGGDGKDTVVYPRSAGIEIRVDNARNDGAPGESDLVLTEDAIGGAGDDLFVGDGDEQFWFGKEGNDTYDAAGGDDYVEDTQGDDTVSLGDGDDKVHVQDNRVSPDTLDGGDGHDTGKWDGNDSVLGMEID